MQTKSTISNIFFSNKYRCLKIVASILILYSLGIYNTRIYNQRTISIQEALDNPELHDGSLVRIWESAKIIKIIPDVGFTVQYRGAQIDVIHELNVNMSENDIGQNVSIEATFHKAKYLQASKIFLHNKRIYKKVFSIIAAFIVFTIFIQKYKFHFKNFVFQEKNDA